VNPLSERLHAVLALDPTAPAVEFDGAWSTWGELASAAAAVDAAMRTTGLGAGAPVGLMVRNRPAALAAFLGLLRAGACVVTVNPLPTMNPEVNFHRWESTLPPDPSAGYLTSCLIFMVASAVT